MTGSLIDEVALAAAREHEILDYYGVIAPGGGVAAAGWTADGVTCFAVASCLQHAAACVVMVFIPLTLICTE